MEIKHRCSRPQFKAMGAWCWDAECHSQGKSLMGPLLMLGVHAASRMACWETNAEHYFHLFFCKKRKSFLDFFQLGKTDTDGFFVKVKWQNTIFWKAWDTCSKWREVERYKGLVRKLFSPLYPPCQFYSRSSGYDFYLFSCPKKCLKKKFT